MDKMSQLKFKKTAIPHGRSIKSWPIYEDALTADVLINATIAKTHDLAILTMGMKNLMGVIKNRGDFHSNIGQRLADLSTVVRPTLTVKRPRVVRPRCIGCGICEKKCPLPGEAAIRVYNTSALLSDTGEVSRSR